MDQSDRVSDSGLLVVASAELSVSSIVDSSTISVVVSALLLMSLLCTSPPVAIFIC